MEKIKEKVLILGSTGMLGHVFYNTLTESDKYEVVDIVYRNKLNENSIICDVTDKVKLEILIKDLQPDIIVNCIGVLITGSATNPENAIYINSFLPHYLASIALEINARLIHISTDCVFSGSKGSYVESDFRDADDVYGRSKALGEILGNDTLTIRTSIIGPEIKTNGEGLLHWFLKQNGVINGYKDAYWGGVTTLELSKAILAAIDQNIKGLLHLTNGIPISKLNMLQLFQQEFKRDQIIINSFEGKRVDKSLQSERKDFRYQVPAYDVMFNQMHSAMEENSTLYKANYIF